MGEKERERERGREIKRDKESGGRKREREGKRWLERRERGEKKGLSDSFVSPLYKSSVKVGLSFA